MKNEKEITKQLDNSKAFVTIHASDTSSQIEEEIQSQLSQSIKCAKDDDLDGLKQALDAIDDQKVDGWDLTSNVRKLLE